MPSENLVCIGGIVCRTPVTRMSPAGIPLIRFTLEHRSRQTEAGMERDAYCRIVVVVCGKELQKVAGSLTTGDDIQVSGFLMRTDYRQEEGRLELHAQSVKQLVHS